MSQPLSLDDVAHLGTIMGIWAHPDDETFCSGGLMTKAIDNGQHVICVTATKGEKGIQDPDKWPPSQLGFIREAELADALEILGVRDHHYLDYEDGDCSLANTHEAADKLRMLIDKYQPDTILTFGPDGLTGHPDHKSVSSWVEQATKELNVNIYQVTQLRSLYDQTREADERFNIFFNLDEPNLSEESDCQIVVSLTPELLERKCKALLAMPSQYEAMYKGLGEESFKKMFAREAFKAA